MSCQCHGHDNAGEGGPDCKSIHEGKEYCYVEPGVCSDSKESSSEMMPGTNISMHYSFLACANPTTTFELHKDQECTDNNDLMGDETPHVANLETCRALCLNSTACISFEWHDARYKQSLELRQQEPTCKCNGKTKSDGYVGGPHCTSIASDPKVGTFCYTDVGACSDSMRSGVVANASYSHVACALAAGGCSGSEVAGNYTYQGATLDGKPYYFGGADTNRYIYHDADCGGSGTGDARWIVDDSKPSTTATTNLNGRNDGNQCWYKGRIASSSATPPAGTNGWRILCDGTWTDVRVEVIETGANELGLNDCHLSSSCSSAMMTSALGANLYTKKGRARMTSFNSGQPIPLPLTFICL